MGMDNRKTSGGSFVAALVFFVMTASIAIFLLLTALVVWLSEVTGSFILSSLIVGGFFAVLAAVIYLLAIREGVERIRKDHPEGEKNVSRILYSGWVLRMRSMMGRPCSNSPSDATCTQTMRSVGSMVSAMRL